MERERVAAKALVRINEAHFQLKHLIDKPRQNWISAGQGNGLLGRSRLGRL